MLMLFFFFLGKKKCLNNLHHCELATLGVCIDILDIFSPTEKHQAVRERKQL